VELVSGGHEFHFALAAFTREISALRGPNDAREVESAIVRAAMASLNPEVQR
jgi:hypothetical protein